MRALAFPSPQEPGRSREPPSGGLGSDSSRSPRGHRADPRASPEPSSPGAGGVSGSRVTKPPTHPRGAVWPPAAPRCPLRSPTVHAAAPHPEYPPAAFLPPRRREPAILGPEEKRAYLATGSGIRRRPRGRGAAVRGESEIGGEGGRRAPRRGTAENTWGRWKAR